MPTPLPNDGGGRPTDWWLLGATYDPVPQDPDDLATMATRYRLFSEAIAESARGAVGLLNDKAVIDWLGKSGDAFKTASEPFPQMLTNAAKAYEEVSEAFATFSSKVRGIRAEVDQLTSSAMAEFESFKAASGLPDAMARTAVVQAQSSVVDGYIESHSSTATPASYRQAHASWSKIRGMQGTLEAHSRDLVVAKHQWTSSVQDATDPASSIIKFAGMAGPAANFGAQFAALGGDIGDLTMQPGAGVDIGGAEIPPPDSDPADVAAWWTSLDPAVQAKLAAEHPDLLGSLDGVPCTVRDSANRKLLAQKIAELTADGSDPGLLATLKDLQAKLDQTGQVGKTNNHSMVQGDLLFTTPLPPLLLLHFDTVGNGHFIMAAGDPDHAANVATYVPGLNTKLGTHTVDNDIAHTENIYLQAKDQHAGASIASVFWLGYDTPQAFDSFGTHNFDVMSQGDAKSAVGPLTSFVNGLRATNATGTHQHLTLIGHSYGSLAVGETAKAGNGLPVDDIVLIGSPGTSVPHASDFHLPAGHVWAGNAANDPVPNLSRPLDDIFYLPFINDSDSHGAWFGQNPTASSFGAHVFTVAPGDDGGAIPGLNAHGQYFTPDNHNGATPDSLDNMVNISLGNYGAVY